MLIGFSPSSSLISYTSAGDRSFATAARNCWSSSILRSCTGVRARDWLCHPTRGLGRPFSAGKCGPSRALWLVQLRRGESRCSVGTSGDQDAAVGDQGRSVASANGSHRPGQAECAALGVIQFGGVESR